MSVKPAVKHELHACQQQVSLLLDSQREQRSIGMDSETLQPDALLAFLPSAICRLLTMCALARVSPSARPAPTKKHRHAEYVYGAPARHRKAQIDNTIATLNDTKSRNQAIGLSADTPAPGPFHELFAVRELPFAMYMCCKASARWAIRRRMSAISACWNIRWPRCKPERSRRRCLAVSGAWRCGTVALLPVFTAPPCPSTLFPRQAHHAVPSAVVRRRRPKPGFIRDAAQSMAIDHLDALYQELLVFKKKRHSFLGKSCASPAFRAGCISGVGWGAARAF